MFFRYSNPENDVYRSDFKRRYAKDSTNPRLLNQDDAILNTKFIYSEEPNIRTNELYTMPHFRQTSTTTTEMAPVENNSIIETNKSVETNSVYMNFTITFSRENSSNTSEESENTTETESTTEPVTTIEDSTTPDLTTTTSSTPSSTYTPGQLFQDSENEEKVNANYKLRGV